MSTKMEDVKRWTAKRKAALVMEIMQGKTTVAEASRSFRKLPIKVNKLKMETSISLRVRDEEVKIYGKSDRWNIG